MLFKKSVDNVVRQFTRTIDDLREIADYKRMKVELCNEEVERLQHESDAHATEGERASKIADKLAKLLGE
jgi:hypothetical protein